MLKRLVGPFREFGLCAGFLYAIRRVFGKISPGLQLYYYELMVQPIPSQPLLPASMMKGLEIRELRRGDRELDLMPRPAEIIEFRLRQNAVCLGVFQRDEFVGYIWFCFKAYDEDEARCTFLLTPQNEAVFDFDLYLFPDHRMGLGFMAIWEGTNRFLRERGIRFSFSRVDRFNLASKRAHDHLGWKRIGRAIFLRTWRIELMVATVAPFLSVSLRESGRVRLRLRPDVLLVG